MRKNRTAGGTLRVLCALLALLMACANAAAEEASPVDSLDMILAMDAASRFGLTHPDGTPLAPRTDPALPGRGEAAEEPDYVGIVGFVSLPKDPGTDLFELYDKVYWTVPLYRKTEGGYEQAGTIPHKRTVLVTGQQLEGDGAGAYRGTLDIVRLDTGESCALDVKCFVTLPYWNLGPREAAAHGYAMAVYRETPGEVPRTGDGKSAGLRDGTKVLIPAEGACPDDNPEPEKLPAQGIVYQKGEDGGIRPVTVYFRESDLTLIY